MGIDILTLIVIAFAAWYVSYVLTSSHGPGGVFDWLREHVWHGRRKVRLPYGEIPTDIKVDIHNQEMYPKNGLLDCPVCLSVWVALLLLIAPMGVVTQALGVAGAAMILHGWSGWRFER